MNVSDRSSFSSLHFNEILVIEFLQFAWCIFSVFVCLCWTDDNNGELDLEGIDDEEIEQVLAWTCAYVK